MSESDDEQSSTEPESDSMPDSKDNARVTDSADARPAARSITDLPATFKAPDVRLSRALAKVLEDQERINRSFKTAIKFPPSIDTSYLAHALSKESLGLFGTSPKQKDLETEIASLKKRISDKAEEFHELQQGSEDQQRKITTLESDLEELKSKEQLRHLLDRVGMPAQELLLNSNDLFDLFNKNEVCKSYVVSIDVRRSTDLMLKAREPRLFAEFITTLAEQLRQIILGKFGVFDKFTGDGILAYFPEFYSGVDAGILVVEAAEACHAAFEQHYRDHRHCFLSVIRDVGLGIGVDFGQVTIVRMQGDLTIVGTPVVYGCRLGGADAGKTLVNQPAYEILMERYSEFVDFEETSIGFKHEGDMVAYQVSRNGKQVNAELPNWMPKDDVVDS